MSADPFLDQLARARAGQVLDVKAPPPADTLDSDGSVTELIETLDADHEGCPICEGMCHDDPAELYAELVGVAEIAERLNVRKAQVTNWAHRAPSNGFPASVHQVHATRLWRWPQVEKWYRGYVPQRQKNKPGRLA